MRGEKSAQDGRYQEALSILARCILKGLLDRQARPRLIVAKGVGVIGGMAEWSDAFDVDLTQHIDHRDDLPQFLGPALRLLRR